MSDEGDVQISEAQAIFDKEKAMCEAFITEFGGIVDTRGTRYRVLLYAEDLHRITEYCRYLRDEAIGERTHVESP